MTAIKLNSIAPQLGIKLNSIEGLMVKKLERGYEHETKCKCTVCFHAYGFGHALIEQGNREITMDREVLAKKMADDDTLWEQADEQFRDYWRNRADGVIKCQSQIIKAVV